MQVERCGLGRILPKKMVESKKKTNNSLKAIIEFNSKTAPFQWDLNNG
jgi:hypothetical protein